MFSPDIERMLENLPDCPSVILRNEFFNSAVLMPLVKVGSELHFVFEKRAANIRQAGEICFPGGKFDPRTDISYQDTAIRETCEELGIPASTIKIKKQLGILIAPMGVAVEAFIGTITDFENLSITLDPNEVEKIFTVPVSYFLANKPEKYHVRIQVLSQYTDADGKLVELLPVKKLNLPERYSDPWRGRKQHVLVYPDTEEVIWGITAELIYEFVNKISSAEE